MTRFNLNVEPKLRSKIANANEAFSSFDYPSAAEVIDMLVMHRIATVLDEYAAYIKSGDMTLKTVFLNWLNTGKVRGSVVLLNGEDIHALGMRLHDEGSRPARQSRLSEVLNIVEQSLDKRGLLVVLKSINITVSASAGVREENDVIFFEEMLETAPPS